ncbi:hypothetical protein BH18THE2_BH18THE2_40280 [soil metagenome]
MVLVGVRTVVSLLPSILQKVSTFNMTNHRGTINWKQHFPDETLQGDENSENQRRFDRT